MERFAAVVKSNPVFQSIYQTAIDRNENVDQPDGSLDEVDGLPATSVTTQPIPADKNKFQLLREAARRGCCAVLKQLGQFNSDNDIDVNMTEDDGVTALHIAVEYATTKT